MKKLYKPQLVFYLDTPLLECPCWNEKTQEISCISIEQNCVYCINPQSGNIQTFEMSGQVGCAVFEKEDHMIVAEYEGIYRLDIKTGEKEFITQLNTNPKLRYNDGILDPVGRFLIGTTGYNCLAEEQNSVYSWNGESGRKLIDGTTISNGIDFSKDNQYMYFVDSPTQKVARYFYDIDTGDIKFDKYIIYIDDGIPDGICTDLDDNLWIAQWGGGKVSKWNPYEGKKIMEIMLPCKNVSSCCIGGENKEYLFVTTAKHDDGTESEELAGGLFRIQIRA